MRLAPPPPLGGHFHRKLYHIRMKKKKHGKRGGRGTRKVCQNLANLEGKKYLNRYDQL